jgi:hypothetical protein
VPVVLEELIGTTLRDVDRWYPLLEAVLCVQIVRITRRKENKVS